jgi:hypothetical protein
MAICESLILVCTLLGELCIGMILGAKRSILELFSGFSAKGRKVNPRTVGQLVVNPDFRASTSQHQVPEVRHKRIPEDWPRNREVKQSQPWSTPKVKVQVKSTLWLTTRSFQSIKEYARYHEVIPRLFLPFVSYRILPHCPSFNPFSH